MTSFPLIFTIRSMIIPPQTVSSNEKALVPGRKDQKVEPELHTPPGGGFHIKETPDHHLPGRRDEMKSLGTIGCPEDDPFVLDLFGHIFSWRISQIKPFNGPRILLSSQESCSGRKPLFHSKASSTVRTGMNSLAPWDKAWTITEVALRMSRTTTERVERTPGSGEWAKAECRSPFSFAKLLYIFYFFE